MNFKRITALLIASLTILCTAAGAVDTTAGDNASSDQVLVPKDYVIPQDESVTIRSKYALVYSEYDDRILYRKTTISCSVPPRRRRSWSV